MPHEYRYRRRLHFAETDSAGVAHFSQYMRFAEEAEHAFLRSLGTTVHRHHGDYALGFPRGAVRFEFFRPIRFEEEFDVVVRVRRIGRNSLTYEFVFSRDEEPIAHGEFTVICCRVYSDGSIESVELPPELVALLEESPEPPISYRNG